MKTIDKVTRSKKGKTGDHVTNFLVESPSGHELLSKRSKSQNSVVLKDLILLKEIKNKRNKSTSFMLSGISLCLSLLFVIAVFEWRTVDAIPTIDLALNTQNFEDLVDVPMTEQIQKPPVQSQAPAIIEVNDEEVIEEIQVNLDIEMTEDTRIENVVFTKVESEILPEESAEEIFTIVQEQPSPVGGMKAFYDFVFENLKYPAKASRMGIEGRVFVEFVVERDGSLTDIKVAKGIGGGCDEEAVRVISEAPKWNPGKQRGKAVRVRMIMPIMFKLL